VLNKIVLYKESLKNKVLKNSEQLKKWLLE
jgi:hypothetical protein